MTEPALPPPNPQDEDARRLVETAFLSSTAALLWLVSVYLNPALPLVRLFFPLPVAIAVLRWNVRAGQMCLTVSTLLLTVLLGPTRSIIYLMPYGLLGLWLGWLWQRQQGWVYSVSTGSILSSLGLIFQLLLSSLLVGENLWALFTLQLTGFVNWLLDVSLSWMGLHVVATVALVRLAIVGLVVVNSVIYVFTLHLVAALIVEKLGQALPPPPRWVQVLLV